MSDTEYEKKLNEYIEIKGGNKGTGFFGKWAWYSMIKKEFDKKLKEENATQKNQRSNE